MTDYYARAGGRASDGTATYATDADRTSERDVARALEQAWACELRPFGSLAPVDWYALRHGRIVGIAELKSRSHAAGTHETVWLNVRKWLALHLASVGMGVRGVFVVRFADDTRWIDVSDIDARRVRVAGCRRIVKSASDVEPVIEVPVESMGALGAFA